MEKKEHEEGKSEKRYSIEEYLELERKFNGKHEYYQGKIYPSGAGLKHNIIEESALDYNKKNYTIEEYLEMERASGIKHEYYQGEIFAMAGASPRHNFIHSNVFFETAVQLRKKSCKPLGSDMRLHIPENTLFTYPDIAIYCGTFTTTDKEKDTILHPTIIIEILSKSTRAYDMGKKFELYKAIPTLKEYLLIDSESIGVKSWRINAHNFWEPEEYKTLKGTVRIPTVGVSLSMKEIYNDVKFT